MPRTAMELWRMIETCKLAHEWPAAGVIGNLRGDLGGTGRGSMPPFIRTLLQAIVGLVVICAIWAAAAAVMADPLRLPTPAAALPKAIEPGNSREYQPQALERL